LGSGALADDLHHLRAHFLKVHAEALEHSGRYAFTFAHETEQQMLCPNVMVIQAPRFIDGELNDLLGAGCQPDFAHDHRFAATNNELDG
jgi:hypothetical protein